MTTDADAIPLMPDAMPVTLTSADVAALARITYRQLDHWTRSGLVLPAGEPRGSGYGRDWSLFELAVVCRMATLVALGVTPRRAAHIARTGEWA